jgi:hypothetical protein
MIDLDLGKHRKARVWLDELPATQVPAGRIVTRVFRSAKLGPTRSKTGALEVFIPLGARFMYGLLGGRFQPSAGNELRLEISVGRGDLMEDTLSVALDHARVGLSDDYAVAVAAGVRLAAERSGPVAGEFSVSHAAFGEIGSSEAVFKHLAASLSSLLTTHASEWSAAQLLHLFPEVFD